MLWPRPARGRNEGDNVADSRFLIYGLTDPRTGQVRYIGKSSRGLDRLKDHSIPYRLSKDRTYKGDWIRKLRSLGMSYGAVILEECAGRAPMDDRERWWIAFARAWGLRLTNLTDGGDGCPGFTWGDNQRRLASERLRKLWKDPVHRDAFIAVHKGKKLSAEQIEAMRVRATGKSPSEETRRKLAIAARARLWSEDTRRKISESQIGKIVSSETKARIGAANRGRVQGPEERRRRGDASRGRRASVETRAKMSAWRYAYYSLRDWGCAL